MIVKSAGRVLAEKAVLADSFWSRFVGLMGRAGLEKGEGLWLEPCASIHMFFMRFPIDAVFVDADKKVVRVFSPIRPWRMTPYVAGARSCLELPAGVASDLKPGDQLELSS